MTLRTKRTAPESAARIRLSVLEPPCRCREPLVADSVRDRRALELDLRSTECCRGIGPVLRAASDLRSDEYLRVHTRTVSMPLLAAIQANGHRFQIVARTDGHVETIVWQLLTAAERQRYLRDAVDMNAVGGRRRSTAGAMAPS